MPAWSLPGLARVTHPAPNHLLDQGVQISLSQAGVQRLTLGTECDVSPVVPEEERRDAGKLKTSVCCLLLRNRTSLAVQWLRLHASTAGGAGSIPSGGNKIPHATCRATQPKQKKWRITNRLSEQGRGLLRSPASLLKPGQNSEPLG